MGIECVSSIDRTQALPIAIPSVEIWTIVPALENRAVRLSLVGTLFSGIVEGPSLETAVDLKINTVYLDPQALDGLSQLFVSYDCIC